MIYLNKMHKMPKYTSKISKCEGISPVEFSSLTFVERAYDLCYLNIWYVAKDFDWSFQRNILSTNRFSSLCFFSHILISIAQYLLSLGCHEVPDVHILLFPPCTDDSVFTPAIIMRELAGWTSDVIKSLGEKAWELELMVWKGKQTV